MTAIDPTIARLLVAYFTHTITVEEMSLLDEWISADEVNNMKVFEDCLGQSLKTQVYDPERDRESLCFLLSSFRN